MLRIPLPIAALMTFSMGALAEEAEPAAMPELDIPEAPAPAPPTAAPTTAPVATATAAPSITAPSLLDRGGVFGLGLVVAPKVGGALGSLFMPGLGLDVQPELEVGYLLPLPEPVGRSLEVFASPSYAAPSMEQTVDANDPRLGDGTFHYVLTEHQLGVTWGVISHIPLPIEWMRPTVGVGVRTVWSWTAVRGDAGGQDFGETLEAGFGVGAGASAGAEFFIGPGAVSTEVGLSWLPADRFLLADTHTLSLGLSVGYRFIL